MPARGCAAKYDVRYVRGKYFQLEQLDKHQPPPEIIEYLLHEAPSGHKTIFDFIAKDFTDFFNAGLQPPEFKHEVYVHLNHPPSDDNEEDYTSDDEEYYGDYDEEDFTHATGILTANDIRKYLIRLFNRFIEHNMMIDSRNNSYRKPHSQ